MAYDIYPSVDEEYNFPPEVRQAFASSNEIKATIGNELTLRVPEEVAEAIGSDRAVFEAAIAAMNDALNSSDVLKGSDVRALKIISPDSRWATVFTDKAGRVAGGFTKQGIFETVTIPQFAGDFVRGTDSRSMIQLSPDSKWAFAITDSVGNVSFGVTKSGDTFTAGSSSAVARKVFAIKGDSLVRGYTNQTAWDLSEAWPHFLGGLLPEATVYNAGYGGRTLDDIRVLTGDTKLWVKSLEGGQIPASGPVSATVNQKIGVVASRDNVFYGALNGVYGNLTRFVDGSWTFERSTPGTAVPFTSEAALRRDLPYSSATSIIWGARNDLSNDVLGAEDTLLEHMKASMRDWIAELPGDNPQFLIFTPMNRTDEPKGSVKYEILMQYIDWLFNTYPGRVKDIRSWFINEAIYELGLTPTSADLAAIAQDSPPPQITDGGSHYIKSAAPLIAAKAEGWIKDKGFI